MYLVFAWAVYTLLFRTDLCQGHSVGASRFKLRPHFGQPQLLNNTNIYTPIQIYIYIYTMQTDLLRVPAKGGANQQSSSKGTLPGNIVYKHLLRTFAISLRIPTPQIGPGTKHIDLLQIDSAGLDLEDRMFCKHFSKNMSMVSATHCCSNCAEADLPLCLPCVSPDILLSVFVLSLLFIFIFISFPFLFVFPFHLEAAQMKLKLTCCDASLSPVSLSLSL